MQSVLYPPRPIHLDRFHERAKTEHHPLSLLVAGQREPAPVGWRWPPRAAGVAPPPVRNVLAAASHPGAVLATPWGLREGLPPAALSAPLLPPRAVGAGAPQGALDLKLDPALTLTRVTPGGPLRLHAAGARVPVGRAPPPAGGI